jgi:ankyrin repeat protein
MELVLRVSDIEVKDHNGVIALSYAAVYSSVDMVKFMLNGGALVRTKGPFGRSLTCPLPSIS